MPKQIIPPSAFGALASPAILVVKLHLCAANTIPVGRLRPGIRIYDELIPLAGKFLGMFHTPSVVFHGTFRQPRQ